MTMHYLRRAPLRAGLSISLLLVCASSVADAAAPAGPDANSDQTQPATKPAADHSAPDKTWAAMCAAVRAGDRQAFRDCCYNHNEISSLFIDAYCDTIVTTYQLAQATAGLGDEGKKLSADFQTTYNDLVKIGENRKVDADEETAVWIPADPAVKVVGQRVLYFKRVNGEWLLDTNRSYSLDSADGRKVAEGFLASTGPQLKLLKAIVAELQAGKITSVQQLRERLSAKVQ
jgi:hypothetical protein